MSLSLGSVDIRKTIEAAAEGIQDRLATDRIKLKSTSIPTSELHGRRTPRGASAV